MSVGCVCMCVCTTLHVSEDNMQKSAFSFLGSSLQAKGGNHLYLLNHLDSSIYFYVNCVCAHMCTCGDKQSVSSSILLHFFFSSTEPVLTDSQNSWARICLCPYNKLPPLGSRISSRAQLLRLGIQIQALKLVQQVLYLLNCLLGAREYIILPY